MSGVLSAAVSPPSRALAGDVLAWLLVVLAPLTRTLASTIRRSRAPHPRSAHGHLCPRRRRLVLGRAHGHLARPPDPPDAAGTFVPRGVARLLRDPAGRLPHLDLLRHSRPEPGPHHPQHDRPPGRPHPDRGRPPPPPSSLVEAAHALGYPGDLDLAPDRAPLRELVVAPQRGQAA